MGEPSVQLPDPLEASTAPAGGTDDLLSQMAGKEIDRLMADAGVEPTKPEAAAEGGLIPETMPELRRSEGRAEPEKDRPIAVAPPKNPEPPAATAQSAEPEAQSAEPAPSVADALPAAGDATSTDPASALTKELDQVFEQQVAAATADDRKPDDRKPAADGTEKSDSSASASTAADSAGIGEASTTEPMSTDGVSELLGRLDAGERPPPPEPTTPTADIDPPSAPSADATAATTAAGSPDATTPAAATTTEQAGSASAIDASAVTVPPGESWLSRTLVAVLDPFGDEARDLIGKIAIITAVNAAAVLLYVWLFRK